MDETTQAKVFVDGLHIPRDENVCDIEEIEDGKCEVISSVSEKEIDRTGDTTERVMEDQTKSGSESANTDIKMFSEATSSSTEVELTPTVPPVVLTPPETAKEQNNSNISENSQNVTVTSPDIEKKTSTSEPGKVIIKNKSSASLSNLLIYTSDDSSSDDDEIEKFESISNAYRIDNDSSSDEETEDCIYQSDDDSTEEFHELSLATGCKPKEPKKPNPMGDMAIKDLPPVPDLSTLSIHVDERECVHMGNISAVVDEFVIVDSLPGIPAYDLETMLFLERGNKPLGRIFDVMGQVSSPIYVVRFNSEDDITKHNITKGMQVYSAPNNAEHTQYVFLRQLMEVKGSDASWVGDSEIPAELQEFSDDEEERRFKSGLKQDSRKRSSIDRHKTFEKQMNTKNNAETLRHRIKDAQHLAPKKVAPARPQPYNPPQHRTPLPVASVSAENRPRHTAVFGGLPQVPLFNPSVPPPPLNSLHFPAFPPLPPNFMNVTGFQRFPPAWPSFASVPPITRNNAQDAEQNGGNRM